MVLDFLSSSICYLGCGVGQGGPAGDWGLGWEGFFFQCPGRLEPGQEVGLWWKRGRFRGWFMEAASAVGWVGNAMQAGCKVNPIFCLLGDFVLLLISTF